MSSKSAAAETARLEALRSYAVLDTADELEFDDLTALASHICQTPISLISLVDENRQWFKSRVGLEATETSRAVSFCSHALGGGGMLEVSDAKEDARFADNPLVTGDPHIRFYAGAPLTTPDGHDLGTLCVVDQTPRELTPDQRDALQRLARQVVGRLELRKERLRAERAALHIRELYDHAPCAYHSLDATGVFRAVNETELRWLGYRRDEMLGRMKFTDLLTDAGKRTFEESFPLFKAQGHIADLEFDLVRKDGTILPVVLSATAELGDDGSYLRSRSAMFDNTDRKRAMAERDAFFDASLDLLCAIDQTGKLVTVNRAYEKMLGRTREGLLELPLEELVHPDDLAGSLEKLGRLNEGESAVDFQARSLCADGSVRWISWNAVPDLDRGLIFATGRDETELRKGREALALSEERYRLALEASALGTFDWDMVSGAIQVGPRFRQLLGRGLEQIHNLEKTVRDFVWKEDVPQLLSLLGEIQEGKSSGLDRELRVRTAAGTPLWVHVVARVTHRDADGAPKRMIGTLGSIENRRKMEEEVRMLSARVGDLLAASGSVLYTRDAKDDLRTTYVSSNIGEILGYTPEECLQPGFWRDHTHPDDLPHLEGELRNLVETGSHVFEGRLRHSDGDWRWMLNDARMRYDEHGTPVEMVMSMMDVTAQREASHEMVRFKEALDRIDDAVFMLSPDDLRFTYVNQGAVSQLGYSREEFLAMHLPDIVATPEAAFGEAMAVLAGGGVISVEGWHRHKDGREIPVDISSQVVQSADAPPLMVAIARDITMRKRHEQDIQKQFAFQRMVADISAELLTATGRDSDDLISGALRELGGHLGVQRGYVFQLLGERLHNTHEWCAEGTESLKKDLQDVPVGALGWLMRQLGNGDVVAVSDIEALPEGAAREKEDFRREGVRSLIAVPVVLGGALRGFVGLDSTVELHSWSPNENSLLEVFGGIISGVIQRASTDEALKELNLTLERQVRERTLALSEAERAGGVGSFEFDLNTGSVIWTDVLHEIYGRDPETFVPSYETFMEHIHVDDRDDVQRAFEAALEVGGTYEHVKRIVRTDGEIRMLETRAEVLASEDGRPTRVVGVCMDVTDRLQAEREVQQSERRFQDLFEFAPDAIVMTDSEGIIGRVNRQAETLFGYAREELAGRRVEMLMPESARRGHGGLRESYLEEPTARSMGAGESKLVGLKKDGTLFPIDISLGPMQSSEGMLIAAAVRDVSERTRAESAMREVLAEKEILLKEIHHRVKNNLQVISSLLSLQADSGADVLSAELLRKSMHRVRSMALIHERLYESGHLARIDFGEYTRSLATFLFRAYAVGGVIDLVLDIEESIELNIETAVPLGLVLNELVSNALKHAFPEGDEGTVLVSLQRRGEGYSLTVRDTGPGLPPEFSTQSTTSLGMTLVDSLVRQLKATLVVGAEGGADFRVDFEENVYAPR